MKVFEFDKQEKMAIIANASTPRLGRLLAKVFGYFCLFVIYLISTVPVGMTLYAIKSKMGWDVFTSTGFHSFATCLASEEAKAKREVLMRASRIESN